MSNQITPEALKEQIAFRFLVDTDDVSGIMIEEEFNGVTASIDGISSDIDCGFIEEYKESLQEYREWVQY